MQTALITSAASIVAVMLGFVTTYILNRRLERHKNQLTRVNALLSQLYGPLFALTQSNAIALKEFSDRNDPLHLFDHSESEYDARMTELQRASYRQWVQTVFQPNNKRILDTLLTKADLLAGGQMPPSALRVFAHVAGYDVVLLNWSSGNFESLFSIVDYPKEFTDYVAETYVLLQNRQSKLLVEQRQRRFIRRSTAGTRRREGAGEPG